MARKDQINVYHCDTCGGDTVTVDLDEGVTPAFIRCRAGSGAMPPTCKGTAVSSGYRVAQDQTPNYGWYSPDARERKRLDSATLEHVIHGGLLIRKLDPEERERFGAVYRR